MKNQCMGLINLEKKGNPNINILNYARARISILKLLFRQSSAQGQLFHASQK